MLLTLLTACIKNNEYGGSIGTSEIKEAQTTNEVALTNLNLGIAYPVSYTHLTLPTIYSV